MPARILVLWVAAALLAWGVWHPYLSLELLGSDSYPLVFAARIRDLGDFLGTFTEEFTDGQYVDARFYRPLVNVSFALDYAVWGLRPVGYHLTALALCALQGVAVFAVARRWLGAEAWIGPGIAALVVITHPIQAEILPFSPRRGDSMAVLFSLIAIWLQPGALGNRGRGRLPEPAGVWPMGVLAGASCLAAVAAKETGVMAVALAWITAFVRTDAPDLVRRIPAAFRASAPAWIFCGVFLLLRAWLLGGLGGSRRASLIGHLGDGPGVVWFYAGLLSEGAGAAGIWLLVLLALLVGAVSAGREASTPVPWLLLAWLAIVALLSAVPGLAQPWYALPFLPVLALSLGFVAERGRALFATGPVWLAGAACLAVLVITATNLHETLARRDLVPLSEVSDRQRAFLSALDTSLGNASRGSVVRAHGWPAIRRIPVAPGRQKVIYALADYSVRAWADLVHPDKAVRIMVVGRDRRPRVSDGVLIALRPHHWDAP